MLEVLRTLGALGRTAGPQSGRRYMFSLHRIETQDKRRHIGGVKVAYLFADPRSAPERTGLPSPVSGKAHSMPTHDSLWPDDGYGVKNAKTATIEPNEQGSVNPTQMQSMWRALPQNIELMPQDQVFGFQPPSRLEAVAQHTDEKEANCNH